MRIHHFDGADRSLLSESRSPPSSSPPREAARSVTIAISSEVRALVSALTRSLQGTAASLNHDILTHADRLMLACALELVHAQGADLAELEGLVRDLAAHRLAALARAQVAAGPAEAPAAAGAAGAPAEVLAGAVSVGADTLDAQLSLPRFSDADEAAARTLLSRLALRDTQVDRGFVRALLDPDVRPTHAVRIAFLDRVVTALSPAHADARVDPALSFVRRDARLALGDAVAALALSPAELSRDLAVRAPLGIDLLRARARLLDAAAPDADAGVAWRVLVKLTRDDRAVLGMLYAATQARGGDLRAVDDVLTALVALRTEEQAERAATATPARLQTPTVMSADAADGEWATRANAGTPTSEPLRTHLAARADDASVLPAERAQSLVQGSVPEESFVRSFGSATQIAARLHASYRRPASWAPLGGGAPSAPPGAHAGAPAAGAAQSPLGEGAVAPFVSPPLHLAEALGLAALVSGLHAQSLRARRLRSARGRAPTMQVGMDAAGPAHDEQLVDERVKRRRARWRRFARRRSRRASPRT